MSFFSIEFGLLLLAFMVLYWVMRPAQALLLLGFNYLIIYLFSPYFALIVFIYTCLVYCLSIIIDEIRARFALLACVLVAILFLCFFKYYGVIKDDFDALLGLLGLDFLHIDILFPLGISFYTFASITYLCAVYEESKHSLSDTHYEEGNAALESFLPLATYLSFFPTFMAGPIFRSKDFFAQLHAKREFGASESASMIVALILFGVVKKVLIANYLEIYSSPILANPANFHSLELLCAIFAYSVQLYCDFSGYVNLVCAFGLMLGFCLPPNFDMPYMARNLKDFWNRWHISLSTFIRDYIYIPLGGNRRGFLLAQIFVLLSFALSGIWHGNTLSFLIWGLWHGFGIVWLNCLKAMQFPRLPSFFGSMITFLFVCAGWVFFYYHSLEEALGFFSALFGNFSLSFGMARVDSAMIAPPYVWWLLCAFVLIFVLYPLSKGALGLLARILGAIPTLLLPFVLAVIFTLIVGFMPQGIPNFIYASF